MSNLKKAAPRFTTAYQVNWPCFDKQRKGETARKMFGETALSKVDFAFWGQLTLLGGSVSPERVKDGTFFIIHYFKNGLYS